MCVYDVAIIGAGPAGLSAAQRIRGSGKRAILIDKGRSIDSREKDVEAELTQGHGGAGLYSDGKFSFFPSASSLWSLPRNEDLCSAYDWTCSLLQSFGLDAPPLPQNPEAYTVGRGEWVLKEYPSDYLSLSARVELITRLVETLDAEIITEVQVLSCDHNFEQDNLRLVLEGVDGRSMTIFARRVIIASGRFGPLSLPNFMDRAFRRLEVGFRIEEPQERAFFRDMSQLDPKLKFRSEDGHVEWRTFCACRDGETVLTRTHGLWTVSGHSDGPPSGRSNVGFNTRVLDAQVAKKALEPMLHSLVSKDSYFHIKLQDILAETPDALSTFNKIYGDELSELMFKGLRLLVSHFPSIDHPETRLIGPTLEGVGWYPNVNGDLRVGDEPIWIAGDACGLFRGIVAALISGHYAASAVLDDLNR